MRKPALVQTLQAARSGGQAPQGVTVIARSSGQEPSTPARAAAAARTGNKDAGNKDAGDKGAEPTAHAPSQRASSKAAPSDAPSSDSERPAAASAAALDIASSIKAAQSNPFESSPVKHVPDSPSATSGHDGSRSTGASKRSSDAAAASSEGSVLRVRERTSLPCVCGVVTRVARRAVSPVAVVAGRAATPSPRSVI